VLLDEPDRFVGVLDTAGTLLDCTRAGLHETGLVREDLVGKPVCEAVFWTATPETRATLMAAIERAAGGEFVRQEVELSFARDAGGIVGIDLTLRPIESDDGRVVLISVGGRWVRAHERTADPPNADPDRVQQSAAVAAASHAKDELLAMLAHELRNPLSPTLTALALMKLEGAQAYERARSVIERRVSYFRQRIDDVLDVSRIARGTIELDDAFVETAEIVAEAVEMATPLLDQRAQTLTVNVPRRGLGVYGDRRRLSQVISQLLTNAVEYTPPGGTIDVRAESVGLDVVLHVRDDGSGIASDVLPHVFDLVARTRHGDPEERALGGLGVGLFLVRHWVERHGGSVSAHSDGPGRGSEFFVRLPRATRSASGIRPTLRMGRDSEPPRSEQRRLLVVDHDGDAARALAAALAERGYEARVSHDAPSALALAAEFLPDVAFVEIDLPVVDGYELAELLRRIPGLSELTLVAVSRRDAPAEREKTSAAGFARHLVKPIDLSVAEAALERRSA
jgi:signal transduction histidine kinase/CheY-like chemotaxis protein